MMSWIKVIAPFVSAIGLLMLGPVSTMIMFPEKSEVSYVFGVIDGLLAGFAIQMLFTGFISTLRSNQEVGSSRKRNAVEWFDERIRNNEG